MFVITVLMVCFSAVFNLMPVDATPVELDKINDPLRLKLWNATSIYTHLHNPRCGIAEPTDVTVEFIPDNENYLSPGCRVIGHLMPNAVDFIFGCPNVHTTNRGLKRIKFYYETDADQILDWDNKKEQRVRGDLKVVDTTIDAPDVAHVPVHVS